jgi:ferredoxin-NADP reductase
VRVDRRGPAADGVVSLVLASEDERALPSWVPGAHIDVYLPGGLVRQYSLCGDPTDHGRYEIAVLREADGVSRGGSQYVHDRLQVDDVLEIGPPRNNFPLEPASGYRLVAGGIGITPLVPMLEAVTAEGASSSLVYGARTRAAMAFLPRLGRYGSRVTLCPQDECGQIDVDAVCTDLGDAELIYVCGPAGLLAAVRDAAERHGCAAALRYELFAAPPESRMEADVETSFDVVLARSGITLRVEPGESVLARMLAAGVTVFSECEEGICGSCECAVMEGEVEHRDHVLTGAERAASRSMMVCVSRARGRRIVLDA